MQNLKKLLFLLSELERKRAVLLLVLIIIMAFFEMIGVASVMPFIAVLTNPGLIETNIILKNMFQLSTLIGVENEKQFLFFLGILVFVLLIISLIFKALTAYIEIRFIYMSEYSISKRLVEGYLNQPYSWFLNRNSADLGKTILSEVTTLIGAGISPMIQLISKSVITIVMLFLLTLTDAKLTLMICFVFLVFYGGFYIFTRGFLNRIGKERLKANRLRFISVNEAFGATKEVKVSRLEKIYTKRFSQPARAYVHHQATSQILSQLPRYALEAIVFGGMMMVILYLMTKKGTFNNALPIISVFAFAGYRLIPALQRVYTSVHQLRFAGPAIDELYNEMKNLKPLSLNQDHGILPFNKTIVLKNIFYQYPNSTRTTLEDINLNITAQTSIGLVGATGSGKTSTADIILGLIEPQKGTLEVDGQVITKNNIRAWQRSIGYVPQNIYLVDDTIANNIAYGQEPKDINLEAIEKAAKTAKLHEFVINELPNQYQTTIGERGIRLSGGQRQRIGIARALYHNPKVMIMDESTNSLDFLTEQAIIESINNISKDITTILITHRLNTLKKCDVIYLMENGSIRNKGTFKELFKIDDYFRKSIIDN